MFSRLYIHIPWCLHKCPYCAFSSAVPASADLADTPHLLQKEMELAAATLPSAKLESIYIGGGTPTLLSPGQIASLIENAFKTFHVATDCEITMECNPGSLNHSSLVEYRQAGIKRLSIGIQSFNDRFLTVLGRVHTASQAKDCYHSARASGFESISIDLISALPHQNITEWEHELSEALKLAPDHLSIYSLTLEPGTKFSEKYEQDKDFVPDDDTAAAMMELTQTQLEASGYERYEISSYAKPGHRSRHNSGYWQRDGYLGIGPAAHSFIKNQPWGSRFSNPANFSEWKDAIELGRLPGTDRRELTAQEALEEFFFLGLRTKDGIDLNQLNLAFGPGTESRYSQTIRHLEAVGLLVRNGSRIRLSRQGMMLSNQVFIRFIE